LSSGSATVTVIVQGVHISALSAQDEGEGARVEPAVFASLGPNVGSSLGPDIAEVSNIPAGGDAEEADRLRRVRVAASEPAEEAVSIDLGGSFTDFNLNSGLETASWQADFISQFDPGRMAMANQKIRIAVRTL
jgi:hypothetical protein